jgi:hypothetical protein
MKPFGSARTIMSDVSDARAEVTRAADSLERAATIGMLVFALVGVIASLALVIAVSKEP